MKIAASITESMKIGVANIPNIAKSQINYWRGRILIPAGPNESGNKPNSVIANIEEQLRPAPGHVGNTETVKLQEVNPFV